jgi:signal transduction histidine kinase
VAGAVVLNLVLVLLEGWFGFLTIATFTFAYSLIEWPWELLAVGGTAVVAGLAQGSSFGPDAAGAVGRVFVVALNVAIMCGLSWGLRLAQRQEERAATEAERSRLAREIHDTLAQGFAGIVTQLQAADQAPDDAARRRHADAALALARDGLAEARRSVQALRPVALDTLGLREAMAAAARRWAERTGVPVEVRTTGASRPLPTDAEVALLRAAQEALANVERHARAHRVALTLRYTSRGARLEVRDDGRGFDPAEPRGADADGGYGLVAMRERIEALAGDLVVESAPGRGTAIRIEVPA